MRALTDKLKTLVAKPPPAALPIYHGNATFTDGFVADTSGQVWLFNGSEPELMAHGASAEGVSTVIATYGNPRIKQPIRWQ